MFQRKSAHMFLAPLFSALVLLCSCVEAMSDMEAMSDVEAMSDTEVMADELQADGDTNEVGSLPEWQPELTGVHKICSVNNGTFRDTMIVPNGWTASRCNEWRSAVGASVVQIGCVWDSGFSLGADGGWLPPNNVCGWSW